MPRIRRSVTVLARVSSMYPDMADPAAVIRHGRVFIGGVPALNPMRLVRDDEAVVVRSDPVLRGTTKLLFALDRFGIDASGAIALDAGAAAGGFTTALLEVGAARVYAVDVGHGQLRGWLRQDERVVVLERTNIAHLTTDLVPEPLAVITLDLSYLLLALAVPQLGRLDVVPDAHLVALIKPMFELGSSGLPPADRWPEAIDRAVSGAGDAGWRVEEVARSPVMGSHRAVEFFLYARRSG